MAAARLYLDTNIFISTFENSDARAKKLLELLSLNAESEEPFLATSELTLAEVTIKPIRQGNRRLIEIYDNLTIGNSFVQIGIVNRQVLWSASVLRAEHATLRLPDAIHISTAMHFGCTYFLSADKGLKETYSIEPHQYAPSDVRAEISIVQPETAILNRMIRDMPA